MQKNPLYSLLVFLIFLIVCAEGSPAGIKARGAERTGFLEHSSSAGDVVEVTRKSWGQKLGESFYLCVLGAILFICGFPALWFNERRAVRTAELIVEGLKNCHELIGSEFKPELNGKLVFLSSLAENHEPIKDDLLGVSVDKALKLKRRVEMFQWTEQATTERHRDTFGGAETTITVYRYKEVWEDKWIDSSQFKDQAYVGKNPQFAIQTENFPGKHCTLGEYELANHQLEGLSSFKTFYLQENCKGNLSLEFSEKIKDFSGLDRVCLRDNFLYVRRGDKSNDCIGDLRISFQFVPEEFVSLVSCLNDRSFLPYDIRKKQFKELDETKAFIEKPDIVLKMEDEDNESCCVKCCPCGECCLCYGGIEALCKTPMTIDWLYEQPLTKTEIFELKEMENRLATWCIRIVGFLMLVFGIYLFFSPVYELLEALPLLSSVGRFVVFVFAILVAIPISALVIMLAWLFYRPKVALVSLLILMVFTAVLYIILRKTDEE